MWRERARYAYCVGVVGDPGVITAGDLERLLDLLVNRKAGESQILLLSLGGSPAHAWASSRGYSTVLVGGDNRVKTGCAMVHLAHALVVLGDPAPWRRMIALTKDAGVKVQVYRTRPKLPPPARPAWEDLPPDPWAFA